MKLTYTLSEHVFLRLLHYWKLTNEPNLFVSICGRTAYVRDLRAPGDRTVCFACKRVYDTIPETS